MTTVRFPQVPPPVCTRNKTVAFLAVVDGRTTMMEISAEALRDRFGALSSSADELLAAFRFHRPDIEAIVRKKLPDQLAAGWRLVTSKDFDLGVRASRRSDGSATAIARRAVGAE